RSRLVAREIAEDERDAGDDAVLELVADVVAGAPQEVYGDVQQLDIGLDDLEGIVRFVLSLAGKRIRAHARVGQGADDVEAVFAESALDAERRHADRG